MTQNLISSDNKGQLNFMSSIQHLLLLENTLKLKRLPMPGSKLDCNDDKQVRQIKSAITATRGQLEALVKALNADCLKELSLAKMRQEEWISEETFKKLDEVLQKINQNEKWMVSKTQIIRSCQAIHSLNMSDACVDDKQITESLLRIHTELSQFTPEMQARMLTDLADHINHKLLESLKHALVLYNAVRDSNLESVDNVLKQCQSKPCLIILKYMELAFEKEEMLPRASGNECADLMRWWISKGVIQNVKAPEQSLVKKAASLGQLNVVKFIFKQHDWERGVIEIQDILESIDKEKDADLLFYLRREQFMRNLEKVLQLRAGTLDEHNTILTSDNLVKFFGTDVSALINKIFTDWQTDRQDQLEGVNAREFASALDDLYSQLQNYLQTLSQWHPHYWCIANLLDIDHDKCRQMLGLSSQGKTLLHQAAENGKIDESLEKEIASVSAADVYTYINYRDHQNQSSWSLAASKGHENVLQWLIDKHPRMEYDLQTHSESILHVAADFNRLGVVKFLIEQRKQKSDVQINGETALDVAQKKGHTDIVKYLKTIKALNILQNIASSYVQLPQDSHESENQQGRDLIATLFPTNEIDSGYLREKLASDEWQRRFDQWSPAKLLIEYIFSESVQSPVTEQDAQKYYANRRTPLHLAAQENDIQKVKDLLAQDKQNLYRWVTYCDSQGRSALHVAAANGAVEILRMLLSVESSTDRLTEQTLACEAINNGRLEVLDFLVRERNWWHLATDENKTTALGLAQAKGSMSGIWYLKKLIYIDFVKNWLITVPDFFSSLHRRIYDFFAALWLELLGFLNYNTAQSDASESSSVIDQSVNEQKPVGPSRSKIVYQVQSQREQCFNEERADFNNTPRLRAGSF